MAARIQENLVDDEIPLQGGSHASSSHEASLEPTTNRREDLGKHSVYTHFPKDRNCEICKRTKITRAPCRRRNGEAVPRAANFGDLITAVNNCAHTLAVLVLCIFSTCRAFRHLEVFLSRCSFCQVFMCTRVCLPQGPLSLCLRSFL